MKEAILLMAFASCLGFASTSIAVEVTGSVKSVTNTARSIAIEVANKGVLVIKFDAATQFKNASSAGDIVADEVLTVDFSQVGAENLAKTITKVIAPLPTGVTRIAAAELMQLVKKGGESFVLIDSRPAGRYIQGHLPGAVSVPFNELEKEGEKLLPADRAKTLVFYCGGLSCMLSPKSATIAVKLGFKDVRMYPEGEPGWKKMDYATESSASFVKSGNIVLVDLRSAEKAASGYIPRAVNIPAANLRSAEKQFPEFHGAVIVFYSDRDEEANEALEWTREWEYTNATVFPGGAKAWLAAGNQLVTGAVPTKISYVRKLAEGEVSIKDFDEAVKTKSHLVVDVRTAEEFAKGHIAGALNIPAEEMANRSSEIPAGKPVLFHCSSGTRAELAFDVLKEKGIKVRYLRANVEFGPGDKVAIKE
ncbi:MAG: rhodanese-like domain-containing protein [Comamonadaceae bacterium]|jgi:rhodanese-related sulfurtransferase